eukprot:445696-Rhodomonas_salina.3
MEGGECTGRTAEGKQKEGALDGLTEKRQSDVGRSRTFPNLLQQHLPWILACFPPVSPSIQILTPLVAKLVPCCCLLVQFRAWAETAAGLLGGPRRVSSHQQGDVNRGSKELTNKLACSEKRRAESGERRAERGERRAESGGVMERELSSVDIGDEGA